jgi:ParB family chromosome partitioning protein
MNINDAKVRSSVDLLPRKPMLAKRTSAFNDFNRSEIVYLSVDQLVPYKNQARKIFNDQELESLASTIKEHGIRQPLTVLSVQADHASYEVISGERRLRAAKLAGLSKVPCIILLDSEKAEEIALIENIQRQDLHPIELSRALKKICETRGWGGQTELKTKLGISLSTVSELLKLGTLSDQIQEKILEKNIRGRESFRRLLSLKTDEQRLKEIDQFSQEPHSKMVKASSLGSRSLLRIAISTEGIKIQKGKLSNLSQSEKQSVKSALVEIIDSLKN